MTLVRNPHFFSNFFQPPALDQIRVVSFNPQFHTDNLIERSQVIDALTASYRSGAVGLVEGVQETDMGQLEGIPGAQVITSPAPVYEQLTFNERGAAPNAQANGGVSMFTDIQVRQAFVEAFDRCGALRALLGAIRCDDSNIVTDELAIPGAPDHDPSFKLPAYNPADAAKLLTAAGFPVVDNIRRARDGKTPLQISLNALSFGVQVPLLLERMQRDYERSLKITVHLVTGTADFDDAPLDKPGFWSGTFDIAVYGEGLATDPVEAAVNSTIIGAPDAKDIPYGNPMGIIDRHITAQETLGQMAPPGPFSDQVWRDLERYVAGRYYAEPIFIQSDIALVSPAICNYKKSPDAYTATGTYDSNLWNIADWYVAPSCPS